MSVTAHWSQPHLLYMIKYEHPFHTLPRFVGNQMNELINRRTMTKEPKEQNKRNKINEPKQFRQQLIMPHRE